MSRLYTSERRCHGYTVVSAGVTSAGVTSERWCHGLSIYSYMRFRTTMRLAADKLREVIALCFCCGGGPWLVKQAGSEKSFPTLIKEKN